MTRRIQKETEPAFFRRLEEELGEARREVIKAATGAESAQASSDIASVAPVTASFPYTRSNGVNWDNIVGVAMGLRKWPSGMVEGVGAIRASSGTYTFNSTSAIMGTLAEGWRPVVSTSCAVFHKDSAGQISVVNVSITTAGTMQITAGGGGSNNGLTQYMDLNGLRWYAGRSPHW